MIRDYNKSNYNKRIKYKRDKESIDTKTLTLLVRSAILMLQGNSNKIKETKTDVETFLARIKYAIEFGKCQITVKRDRKSEDSKNVKFTNRYTLNDLFPNENPADVMKRELTKLSVKKYIETVKDLDFPERSDLRVFGKTYSADVYIKVRAELVSQTASGNNVIFVLSFHFAEYPFYNNDFPHK